MRIFSDVGAITVKMYVGHILTVSTSEKGQREGKKTNLSLTWSGNESPDLNKGQSSIPPPPNQFRHGETPRQKWRQLLFGRRANCKSWLKSLPSSTSRKYKPIAKEVTATSNGTNFMRLKS